MNLLKPLDFISPAPIPYSYDQDARQDLPDVRRQELHLQPVPQGSDQGEAFGSSPGASGLEAYGCLTYVGKLLYGYYQFNSLPRKGVALVATNSNLAPRTRPQFRAAVRRGFEAQADGNHVTVVWTKVEKITFPTGLQGFFGEGIVQVEGRGDQGFTATASDRRLDVYPT